MFLGSMLRCGYNLLRNRGQLHGKQADPSLLPYIQGWFGDAPDNILIDPVQREGNGNFFAPLFVVRSKFIELLPGVLSG